MSYTPITPFRRAVSAVHLEPHICQADPLPVKTVNKWEILRELGAARHAFSLSDRDLTVLQALVSFHPGPVLDGSEGALIVHASNSTICERLNGMPCSTMRRHLAKLVSAGLIRRRDSPNGKRYVRRYGEERIAFGLDLTPLVARAADICAAAEEARAASQAHQRLRESVSLMRRDLLGLVTYGAETRPDLSLWTEFTDLLVSCAQALRRKLSFEDLGVFQQRLGAALAAVQVVFDAQQSREVSTSDADTEHHCHNSNKESYDSELCSEKQKAQPSATEVGRTSLAEMPMEEETQRQPSMPLAVVLSACPEIQAYAPEPIRHWHQLVRISETLRPMLGISPSAWHQARESMGPEQASIVLAAMLERISDIKSPGGYFRYLAKKAEVGEFSCGPMVMSLMRKQAT